MICEHGEPRGPKYCALCRGLVTPAPTPDEKMGYALDAANEWVEIATAALLHLGRAGRPFSSDDLIALVGLPSGTTGSFGAHENNAVGALFRKYSKNGFLVQCGNVATTRSTSNGRMIQLWRGFPNRDSGL